MKRFVLAAVFVMTCTQVIGVSFVRGGAATPSIGSWDFCTTSQQVGCIESFRTVDDSNQDVVITNQSQRQQYTGLNFDFNCSSLSTNQSICDSHATTPLDGRPVGKCGFTEPAKLISHASWQGHTGRTFQMTVRTGDFDPVFSMGNGISGTSRTVNNDGTFTFVWSGFFDDIKSVSIPSSLTNGPLATNYEQLLKDFFATAVSDSAVRNSTLYVLPASYFHVGVPAQKINGVWVQDCVDLPMVGMWVEANAQMFSYLVGFNGKSAKASSKFSFSASSPHYLSDGITVNPARFNMFIPDSYVSSIGYTTDTFTVSALKIAVADNQTATPVLTRRTGGFGLDFGIAHYSTPNPQLEFYNNNWTEPADTSTASTTTTTTTTIPMLAATKPTKTVRVGKVLSKSVLLSSSGLRRPAGSTSTFAVVSGAKNCRLVGQGIKGLKPGTCKVKVTVRIKKASKSASVSIAVKK